MKNAVTIIFVLLRIGTHHDCSAETPYTPKRNSAERKAICDGARVYVIKNYVSAKSLPKPLVFKIDRIKVLKDYCSFEATPLFADGTSMSTEYMMDIAFDLCLKRSGGEWRVICDLSSTDVPNREQLKQMQRKLLQNQFPMALVPEFWRDLFKTIE